MAQLIVAALARNEAKRYWRSALDAWTSFADKVVVLDDASTDRTFRIACSERYAEKVAPYQRVDVSAAWGAESAARRELWDIAMRESQPGDYVLWLDADMVPMADPRDVAHPGCDTYFFTLYDLWGRDERGRLLYREDRWWRAHFAPRAWMIRRPREFKAEWPTRGIHCGHLPTNWQPKTACYVPPSHSLLHFSYADAADRHEKFAQYARVREQLSEVEWAHAQTIVDPAPHLKPLLLRHTWELKHA